MQRTYTEAGKEYTREEINKAIKNQVKLTMFTPLNLPYCQGACLQAIVKECNIPFSKIRNMSLHGCIKNTHGFYALEVDYKNGKAFIYIADNGCSSCVVASDFLPACSLCNNVTDNKNMSDGVCKECWTGK